MSTSWNFAFLKIVLLIVSAFLLGFIPALASASQPKPLKILHVMSYHAPWIWTDEQLAGFKDGLGELNVDIKVFQMDTKRRSSTEWLRQVSAEALELVETWKPDLVYTNDDNAQKFFASHLVNGDIPVVFSGVNAAPSEYGFVGSSNVTGVLEQEHFVQTIQFLREIRPGIGKVAVILDTDQTWQGVVARMKSQLSQIPDFEVVAWETIETFAEYKKKILAYQNEVDAIGLLGIFNLSDDKGENVPYVDVLRWTAANSRLPDFSFWKSRVLAGTLATVTVSGYEQGLAAGKKARLILSGERKPSEIDIAPSVLGKPVLNLKRATELGLKVRSSILLSSEVLNAYEWEKDR
ncbi:MAG: hypothetical protein JJ900_03290 [Rhodospirillales bacterium]|nr:hypothetical protein [Rhodospirillales bacterium]MBO6785849.1 hypothetical protein [Rhodospirillales bacterium]